jgi:hypothetical protein
VPGFPRKHACWLQRRPLLAFRFGTYYWGLRLPSPRHRKTGRPLYAALPGQSLPISPTVLAELGALHMRKTKLPHFSTVCSGIPDLMPFCIILESYQSLEVSGQRNGLISRLRLCREGAAALSFMCTALTLILWELFSSSRSQTPSSAR